MTPNLMRAKGERGRLVWRGKGVLRRGCVGAEVAQDGPSSLDTTFVSSEHLLSFLSLVRAAEPQGMTVSLSPLFVLAGPEAVTSDCQSTGRG